MVNAELVRVNRQLAHGQAEVYQSRTVSAENSQAQSDLEQALKELEVMRVQYETVCLIEGEEAMESAKNLKYAYQENALYIEHYELWQQALSAPKSSGSVPPGLPAAEAAPAPIPVAAATREPRQEESALKVKEADKLHAPSFPTITNLGSWQSNLSQALVQTSGVRDVRIIIEWISAVWAPGSKIEDFATSGGDAFVTLDVKLSSALQQIIAHGGHEAKDLKDLVNRKVDECMKKMSLITGRQIVFMLLENFKTFDNSEMVYGFDHLVKCECDKDLSGFMSQWQRILDNMCGEIPFVSLRDVFYRKIKHVESLRADMNLYERYREDNKDKTYEWLVMIVNQEIRLQRQNRNTAEREVLITGKTPAKPKANAAPAQENTTPKAKEKAKPKEKDDSAIAELRKQLDKMQKEQTAMASVGGGKSDGKGKKGKDGGKGLSKGQTPCWYFNTNPPSCSRSSEDCYFSHAVISKEEKAKLKKPVSRATSPSGWAPEPKAPGASKGKGKGKASDTGGVQYCYQFTATKAGKQPVGEGK